MTALAFVVFFALLVLGAPIWAAMLVSGGVIAVLDIGLPAQMVVSQLYIAVDSWLLLAVPYFLFAGNLMTDLGLAGRLFRFIENLLGHMRGGLPATGVVTCAIFGALSGSSTATVVAVGSMLLPYMIRAGYKQQDALGIIAVSGTLGQMIPPSVYMILFASLVQMDVSKLFLAGIVPGLVITALLVITAVALNIFGGQELRARASAAAIRRSFLEALPALIMPVVVLGGIYAGIFTPTEAAAVAVVYVLAASAIFERKTFTLKRIFKAAESAVVTSTIIFIILGGATVFANALTFADVPQSFTRFMTSLPVNVHVTMGLILLIFIVLGTVLDPVPILYITIPIVFPVVVALGYSPTHFAILTIACMMVAQVTPPVGMSLFALSGVFNVPIGTVMRGALPYLATLVLALLVLWWVPGISTVFE
ncbi:MAG: TRAP transporter large permease [Rhodobacterales bacterium]|nr:TRAP transporter large permease [Rhodobacterales bacterium]MDX5499152.1 TRAP transporter large permease [Rhodobacterales bacterium]